MSHLPSVHWSVSVIASGLFYRSRVKECFPFGRSVVQAMNRLPSLRPWNQSRLRNLRSQTQPIPKQLSVELRGVPQSLTDGLGLLGIDGSKFVARFGPPAQDDQLLLHRTHPVVEKIAGFVLDAALDPLVTDGRIAKRAGVIRTRGVKKRTTALLLRIRHQIISTRD